MAERKTMDELRAEVRATAPLAVRLERCLTMIGAIAGGRDMLMTVPPRSDDDDIFLSVTLADAVDVLRSPCADGAVGINGLTEAETSATAPMGQSYCGTDLGETNERP